MVVRVFREEANPSVMLAGQVREPRLWRRLADAAALLLDPEAPGDWNQAMMELGATVCTPRAPRLSSAASSSSLMSMVIATTQRARFGVSALSAAMPSRIAELSVP